MFFRRPIRDRVLEPAEVAVGGRLVPVQFRHHATARRIVVRLNRDGDGVVATVPKRVSRDRALSFVQKSADWIEKKLDARPSAILFTPGAAFPLRGAMVTIAGAGGARGGVLFDLSAGTLHVPGGPAHLSRRLTDWLKAEAKRDFQAASDRYARLMGGHVSRINVRDQKSRWGSCTANGTLSYSWRLVLAPPHVLDYVAAHEAAHLRHMNHGPKFWRLVLTHCPGAGDARDWLKAHGAELHRYG